MRKRKKPSQFFTTDQFAGWYPIDHFFYAEITHDKNNRIVEKGSVVHLEAHASMRNANGFSVSVVKGQGEASTSEEFDDYPAALRRMADIIEAHSKPNKKSKHLPITSPELKATGLARLLRDLRPREVDGVMSIDKGSIVAVNSWDFAPARHLYWDGIPFGHGLKEGKDFEFVS